MTVEEKKTTALSDEDFDEIVKYLKGTESEWFRSNFLLAKELTIINTSYQIHIDKNLLQALCRRQNIHFLVNIVSGVPKK